MVAGGAELCSCLFQALIQTQVNAPNTFDLSLGRETLIKTFGTKLPGQFRPWPHGADECPRVPAFLPNLDKLALPDQIAENPQERLEGHIPGEHILFVITPDRIHYFSHRLQIIPDQGVSAVGAQLEAIFEEFTICLHDFVDLVEKFRLKNPLLLPAPPAQPVDAITQRRIALFVEQIDDLSSELLLLRFPRHPFVKIHQVRFVDPGVSRVDDDEHLGGEIGALAVEDYARHLHLFCQLRMFLAKEMERRQPVLAVDDKELALGLALKTDAFGEIRTAKAQGFVGKQKNRTGNQGLTHRSLVEVNDLADFPTVQNPLERFFAFFDAGNEPSHFVFAGLLRFDFFTFKIVAAGETDSI